MVDRFEPDLQRRGEATFEPVPIRRGSRARTRLVMLAWLFGLVGIAGVAVIDQLAEPPAPGGPVLAAAPSAITLMTPIVSPPPAGGGSPLPSGLIVLTSPAEGDPTITAPEIIVQGFVQPEAVTLRVSLETDWYPVQQATVLAADPHFLVRFGISDPRVSAPMLVRVVALDRDGQWLADVLRPFRLGPIERPTLGDDGLVGGIVFSDG